MQEIFLPVNSKTYGELYEISNMGNVRSVRRNIIMKPAPRNGYPSVGLSNKFKVKNKMLHRLVAKAFIPNPNKYKIVNHLDGDRTNNIVSNLEWTTLQGNAIHAVEVLGRDKTQRRGRSTGNDYEESPPEGQRHENFPNYIITSEGKIYSHNIKNYLRPREDGSGYLYLDLSNKGTKKSFPVHVLVATLFLEREPNKTQVNHKDRNKSNNTVENLEWVTSTENMYHYQSTIDPEGVPVIQYDLLGNEIARYNKVRDAFVATQVDASSIVRVCRKKQKTAGDFIWRYAQI